MQSMVERLFRRYSIFDVIENLRASLKDAIKMMPADALQGDVHEIAKKIAARYAIEVPVLHENRSYATEREIQIDVSADPMSQFMHGDFSGEPILVSATEVTVSIPFDGDPDLFEVQPSTFSYNTPAAFVTNGELKLVFTLRSGGPNLKEQYEQAITSVRQHLQSLTETAAQIPNNLEQQAVPTIVARKNDLASRAAAVNSLGIPVRSVAQSEAILRPEKKRQDQIPTFEVTEQEWDVFVSHASEDKDEFARPLAKALEAAGLKVWFDEKSLRLGDSLRQKIDEGLSKSTFGVIVLSKHFFEKHWPQQELNGMANREVDGKKVILPVWHNIEAAEVRKYSPILADRVAVSTKKEMTDIVAQIVAVVKNHET